MPRMQIYLDEETYHWAKSLPAGTIRQILADAKKGPAPKDRTPLTSADLCRKA